MSDIEQGALELAAGTVDLTDVDAAYENGNDSDVGTTDNKPNE